MGSLNCLSAECSIESRALFEREEEAYRLVSIAFRLNVRLRVAELRKIEDRRLKAGLNCLSAECSIESGQR